MAIVRNVEWLVDLIITKNVEAYLTFGSRPVLCQQNILTLLNVTSVNTSLVCILFSRVVIVHRFLSNNVRYVFYVSRALKFNEIARRIYISLIIHLFDINTFTLKLFFYPRHSFVTFLKQNCHIQ